MNEKPIKISLDEIPKVKPKQPIKLIGGLRRKNWHVYETNGECRIFTRREYISYLMSPQGIKSITRLAGTEFRFLRNTLRERIRRNKRQK